MALVPFVIEQTGSGERSCNHTQTAEGQNHFHRRDY